jgi:hypothetical protein
MDRHEGSRQSQWASGSEGKEEGEEKIVSGPQAGDGVAEGKGEEGRED